VRQHFLSLRSSYIENENTIRIESLKREFNSMLETIELMHYKLNSSYRLSPRSISVNSLFAREILYYYRNTNRYLQSLYYDYGDPKYVLTLWGYFDRNLIHQPDENYVFKRMVDSLKEPTLINSKYLNTRTRESIIYIFPDENKNNREFIFHLNVDALRDMMRLHTGMGDKELVYVLAPDGRVLLSSKDENYAAAGETLAPIGVGAQLGRIVLDGETYYYSRTSDAKGLIYIGLINESQYLENILRTNTPVLMIAGILLAAGIMFAFVFIRKVYRPISSLAHSLSATDESKGGECGEIEVILRSFREAKSSSLDISAYLESAKPAMRLQLYTDLINGATMSREEFLEKCAFLGVSLPYKWFAAYRISMEDGGPPYDRCRVIFERCMSGHENVRFFPNPRSPCAEGIINSTAGNENDLVAILTQMTDTLKEKLGCDITVSLGDIVDDAMQLGNSYQAATRALKYRFLPGDKKVLANSYADALDKTQAPYPDAQINKLAASIAAWDCDKISRALSDISAFMSSTPMSLQCSRLICYDITGIFSSSAAQLGREVGSDFHRHFDIYSLVETGSVEELLEAVEAMSRNITAFIGSNAGEAAPKSKEMLINYLKSNIGNPQFSLSTMADDMGNSGKTLRKVFRDATGSSPIEHFNLLRAQEAKRLLTGTDLGMDEISQRLGYDATTSFIRMFRDETGMTPGAYRKRNKT